MWTDNKAHFAIYLPGHLVSISVFDLRKKHYIVAHLAYIVQYDNKIRCNLMVKYNNTYLVVSRHKQKKIRNTIMEAAITIAPFFPPSLWTVVLFFR